MRELMLYSGQDDNYVASSEHISRYLRICADDSQINRLCVHYGTLLEGETTSLESEVVNKTFEFSQTVGSEEVVYSMCDGTMLPTRPHTIEGEEIGSWKEMKLGRIFREQDHLDSGSKPNIIRKSLYVSHFGNHHDFTKKFELVVDVFEPLGKRLVFINDGATWIANWIKENYPNSTDILDFFHASEYLHTFSKIYFSKKTQKTQRTQWLNLQIERLLTDKIAQVIEQIQELKIKGKTKLEAQKKILTYYKNNQHRMLYKTYKERGLLIGSGPIEAAHRFVLQKRMKQSGQKWTKKGGQVIANLRVTYLNNQWDRVIQLINEPKQKYA